MGYCKSLIISRTLFWDLVYFSISYIYLCVKEFSQLAMLTWDICVSYSIDFRIYEAQVWK